MSAFLKDGISACVVGMSEEEKTIMVRIPESLLKRVEAVQDEVFSIPELSGMGFRRSRAQAVRILLIKALQEFERGGE